MVATKVSDRESSFELIRIIAQYMIVLYHLLLVIVYPHANLPFYKAMWLPLHIGVPLFVLISGYFGIKADVKRLVKLLGMIIVLQVPLLVTNTIIEGGSVKDYVKLFFFVSNTPFWFIRTYLFLFLFSPVINYFLKDCTLRRRIMLLIVLCFMSHYIGTLKFDPTLLDGKNLVTFLFLFVIGDTLRKYKDKWMEIPRRSLIVIYLVFNILLVVLFSCLDENSIVDSIYQRIFFDYTSFGLLLNSILFFVIIGGLQIKSRIINSIGKSSLAIYMLHGTPLCIYVLMPPVVLGLYNSVDGIPLYVMALLIFLAVLIVFCCWTIYEILNPVWKEIDKVADWSQRKFEIIMKKVVIDE